jgi:hypothetical protein
VAATVAVIDFATGKGAIFKPPVKGPDDPRVSYLVSGLANATARDKLSFVEYSYAASQVGKASAIPSFLDPAASYAIIKASPRYKAQLRQVLGNPVKEIDVEKKNLKLEQLFEELVAKEALYGPTP